MQGHLKPHLHTARTTLKWPLVSSIADCTLQLGLKYKIQLSLLLQDKTLVFA